MKSGYERIKNDKGLYQNQAGLVFRAWNTNFGEGEMSSASEIGARAEKQLDRVLGFFPRVEAKASFLFALDVGLLGYGAVNLGREDLHSLYVAAFGVAFLALTVASLFHIYWCVFPHLKGGANSLIYFREIAGRTELDFADTFLSRTDESHTRDAAGQIWRNSAILKLKFDYLKRAFVLTMLAIAPWVGFLASVALLHSPSFGLR
jgi:hypothetical protein